MKKDEIYTAAIPAHDLNGHRFKLIREVPFPLNPSIGAWVCKDLDTGSEFTWPADFFNDGLLKRETPPKGK